MCGIPNFILSWIQSGLWKDLFTTSLSSSLDFALHPMTADISQENPEKHLSAGL